MSSVWRADSAPWPAAGVARLLAVALATSGCDADSAPESCESNEAAAPQALVPLQLGVPSAYAADSRLRDDEPALQSDHRRRRQAAWSTVHKVVAAVPVDGLGYVANLPRFQTWYDVADFKRMFQALYAGLGPDGRRARAAFTPAALHAAALDNAGASEPVAGQAPCAKDLSREDCGRKKDRLLAGAAAGTARILYGPATVDHVLRNYSSVVACNESLAELPVDAPLVDPDNFTHCFASEFPEDAVLVKAQWERVAGDRSLSAYDTDAEALARWLAKADWGSTGDRPADPGPDAIYTIERSDGSVFRLSGLHIMTKELRHWQWITLWWSDRPESDFGADRPAFGCGDSSSVWNNYKMCTVVGFDEDDDDVAARFADLPTLASALNATAAAGQPSWCSNPYLEEGHGNADTNCIGCHQHAGSQLAFDFNGDGALDPLMLSRVPADPVHYPDFGRLEQREVFPADYLYSFDQVDDLQHVIQAEVEYFDITDPTPHPARLPAE